ncbi:hypothetical protein GGR56DRAFT_683918 [Xylariaceae sp. FL0804]|nr:hypothetical protein GGR56DRAFT_683918 [Xylariaceae sp. FL0804]
MMFRNIINNYGINGLGAGQGTGGEASQLANAETRIAPNARQLQRRGIVAAARARRRGIELARNLESRRLGGQPPPSPCSFCAGPHWDRDCPQLGACFDIDGNDNNGDDDDDDDDDDGNNHNINNINNVNNNNNNNNNNTITGTTAALAPTSEPVSRLFLVPRLPRLPWLPPVAAGGGGISGGGGSGARPRVEVPNQGQFQSLLNVFRRFVARDANLTPQDVRAAHGLMLDRMLADEVPAEIHEAWNRAVSFAIRVRWECPDVRFWRNLAL